MVSGGLIIRADSGNVDLRGEFSGETDIAVDYGDVDMQTSLTEDMYSFDVNVDYGDLRIGANSYGDSGRIRQGNGAHLIKIVSDAGDVAIDLEDKRTERGEQAGAAWCTAPVKCR